MKQSSAAKPHKPVEDSIFDAFMGEEEEEEEEKKEEKKEESALKLHVKDLVLRAAQIYSKRKFPHLALYMIKAEPSIIQESNPPHYHRLRLRRKNGPVNAPHDHQRYIEQ